MGLTRFAERYDYHTSNGTYTKVVRDGPVSGAIQVIPLHVVDQTAAQTITRRVDFPAGMEFQIVAAEFAAQDIGSTPTVAIGDTSDATAVVNTVTCTTNLGALTIKDGWITSGDAAVVLFTTTASDTITEGSLTLTGYVRQAPTLLRQGTGTTPSGTVTAYR